MQAHVSGEASQIGVDGILVPVDVSCRARLYGNVTKSPSELNSISPWGITTRRGISEELLLGRKTSRFLSPNMVPHD
jgi:hypothetical protein